MWPSDVVTCSDAFSGSSPYARARDETWKTRPLVSLVTRESMGETTGLAPDPPRTRGVTPSLGVWHPCLRPPIWFVPARRGLFPVSDGLPLAATSERLWGSRRRPLALD